MALTRKDIEKKYNCKVSKDSGFDDNRKFWVALENSNEEDETTFTYADGWTLTELVGNIKKELKKYIEETEENINDEITYLEQEIQNKQKEINILNKKMDKLQELKNK